MTGTGLRLALIASMLLLWVGAAFAAPAGSPPAGAFSGDYKVVIKVTNTKSTPSHWIYEPHPTCSSPCHAVSFRFRLTSEKSWRSSRVTLRWDGKAYSESRTVPAYTDCVSKSGKTVKDGYDVTISERIGIRTVTNGRVTAWRGTARDDYIPNATGRSQHCTPGAYLYALTGTAQ